MTFSRHAYGAAVLDDAGREKDPNRRFKLGHWQQTRALANNPAFDGGMWVAFSPDGLNWAPLTGNILLELFQRTKGAQAFTFFAGPLSPIIHSVKVKAQGLIECRANAAVIPCPKSTLDGYTDAQTMAAIGKATLVVEEQQNWGKQ